MGLFEPHHLILILVIALIIFGPGKIADLGGSLGRGVRDFKKAMYGKERIEAVLRREAGRPASAIVNALVADLREFKNGLHLEDDVTLVVIKATS